MTTVHTFASGSSGNALLVSHNGTHLLLDAGISCRRIVTSLRELGLTPADLSGILITHTHSDHISGLPNLLKKHPVPVYSSQRAARELSYRLPAIEDLLCPVVPGGSFTVGCCLVTCFPTSHDAPGSCGYRVEGVGVLTDTGYVTEEARSVLLGVPLLVLEANHDVETLCSGPYPAYLKQRILGGEGHLSNEDAAAFAAETAQSGTQEIILAHLSRENNTPVMARDAVARALAPLEFEVRLSVAPRDTMSSCYTVMEATPCRK